LFKEEVSHYTFNIYMTPYTAIARIKDFILRIEVLGLTEEGKAFLLDKDNPEHQVIEDWLVKAEEARKKGLTISRPQLGPLAAGLLELLWPSEGE
jgi:hypothetical protein